MQRTLDVGLSEIKYRLIEMAGHVERAIDDATQAWRTRSIDRIQQVYQTERKVNECHLAVDDACFKFLATQHPLASDLRFVLSVIKINNDLERIVDQAVNVANNTEYYLKLPQVLDTGDLSKMVDEAKWMLRNAIDAFVKGDEQLAKEICLRDDAVDALKNKVFRDVLQKIKEDVTAVEQGLNLILIARNLERIGDHATNIAEDVIFTISGRDVRHSQSSTSDRGVKP